MGILQEYKFFLIVAIISLSTITTLFFNAQVNRDYVNFNTKFQESLAQLMSVKKPELNDVIKLVSLDNFQGDDHLKGLKSSNKLLGKTFADGASTITVIDDFSLNSGMSIEDIDQYVLNWTPADEDGYPGYGYFRIAFGLPATLHFGDDGGMEAIEAFQGGLGDEEDLKTFISTFKSEGYLVYIFEDNKTALKMINDYIPNGQLIGTAGVAVKVN